MVAGIMHFGSGLGNQLFRFVGTKVIALDKGEEHGMIAPELFKGSSFMDLDMGLPIDLEYRIEYPAGKVVVDNSKGVNIVDGEFQGEADFIHRLDEIREWLKVEPLEMPNDLCVINFRGGEYIGTSLFLPKEYWYEAIKKMREVNKDMRFEVHTDDYLTAFQFFPGFNIIVDMALNWRSIRYAKYLILSNSSFAILPALLGDAKIIYAPKFWGGYNAGEWRMMQNKYERFTYL